MMSFLNLMEPDTLHLKRPHKKRGYHADGHEHSTHEPTQDTLADYTKLGPTVELYDRAFESGCDTGMGQLSPPSHSRVTLCTPDHVSSTASVSITGIADVSKKMQWSGTQGACHRATPLESPSTNAVLVRKTRDHRKGTTVEKHASCLPLAHVQELEAVLGYHQVLQP